MPYAVIMPWIIGLKKVLAYESNQLLLVSSKVNIHELELATKDNYMKTSDAP
jgi:hypothetical protein